MGEMCLTHLRLFFSVQESRFKMGGMCMQGGVFQGSKGRLEADLWMNSMTILPAMLQKHVLHNSMSEKGDTFSGWRGLNS